MIGTPHGVDFSFLVLSKCHCFQQAQPDCCQQQWHHVTTCCTDRLCCFAGLAGRINLQQLTERAMDVQLSCNPSLSTSDAQLKKEAKRLHSFVELMHDELPYEFGLVMHLESILVNLP